MAQQKPTKEIRLGRITAAIWLNEGSNGAFYNVTISRIYKDGNDWRRSDSFGRDDLPLVAKVADLAHTWIYEQPKPAANAAPQNDFVADAQNQFGGTVVVGGPGTDEDIPFLVGVTPTLRRPNRAASLFFTLGLAYDDSQR